MGSESRHAGFLDRAVKIEKFFLPPISPGHVPPSVWPRLNLPPGRRPGPIPARTRNQRPLCLSPFRPCAEEGAGYDVCDHKEFNPAMGTAEDFGALSNPCKKVHGAHSRPRSQPHGHRHEQSLVGGCAGKRPSSYFSCFFDIDLQPVKPELRNKVLLPILEDQYGKVLEDGKFQLKLEEGAFFIHYYDHKLPVAPRTYTPILEHPLEELIRTLGRENEDLQEFQSILTALATSPQTELAPEKLEERKREKEVIKRGSPAFTGKARGERAIESAVQAFNGRAGTRAASTGWTA